MLYLLSEFRSKEGTSEDTLQSCNESRLNYLYMSTIINWIIVRGWNHIFSAALDIPTNTSINSHKDAREKKWNSFRLPLFSACNPSIPESLSFSNFAMHTRSLFFAFLAATVSIPLSPVGRFKRMDSFCLLAVLKTVILSETYFWRVTRHIGMSSARYRAFLCWSTLENLLGVMMTSPLSRIEAMVCWACFEGLDPGN